jgi:hypothetical protein
LVKSIFGVLILAALGVYGTAAVSLSESGANRFLNQLEDLSIQGKDAEYCALLHEDLTVSINDHSANPPADFAGGKQEFCEYVSLAAKGMSILGVSTQVQRDDFTVERSWLQPWTAHISYNEQRTTTMARVNVTLNTASEDRMTLVQTIRGVKLRSLESKAWIVE